MWVIGALDLAAMPGSAAFMSDGLPVLDEARGGYGVSQRLMIAPCGYVDIVDCGASSGGAQSYSLQIGGQVYWNSDQAIMAMTLLANGQIAIQGDGNDLTVSLTPFPTLDEGDLALFDNMVALNLLPYPSLPPDGRPFEDVAQTAANYFAWSPNAAALGLSIYDWTTADFFRMDVFNYYRYTAVTGEPLDDDDIIKAIWTTNWPPYVASDPLFMGSMLMQPASSQAEVAEQYCKVAGDLKVLLDGLKAVTATALTAMPRVSTLQFPTLFSGQVDVSNLGPNALVTYFLEYPGNAGPITAPMGEPLDEALAGFMSPGSVVTLKSFMSTTSSQSAAVQYSNGVLLQITQIGGALWESCAYVTPLSDEATKDEYLFGPGSRFVVGQASQQTIDGKTLTVLPMTALTTD